MRSLMRLMLLCLVALALPLQGYAATGALHCAALHGRMQASAAPHHDDGNAHHHDGHDAAHADSVTGDAGPDGGASRLGGSFKCSACAACCVGLALPAGAIRLPQGPAQGLAPPVATPSVAPFLTGGPERPPRIVLA